MRIAVMIIGLCVSLIILLQSCAATFGGGLAQDEAMKAGGGAGLIVTLLYVVGSACALGLPRVSTGVFAAAGLIGLLAGSHSGFSDLTVWGVVALGLAAMAYFGRRELRRGPGTPA